MTGLTRTLAICLAAATAMTAGCVTQNPLTLQFLGNSAVLRQPGGGAGVSPGTCLIEQAQFTRAFGTLDLMIVNQYDIYPIILNALQPSGTVTGNQPQHLRAEASTITVRGVDVTVKILREKDSPYFALSSMPAARGWTQGFASDSGARWHENTQYIPMNTVVKSLDEGRGRFAAIPPQFGEDLRQAWFRPANPPDAEEVNFKQRYTTIATAIASFQIEGVMADGTVVRSQRVDYPVNLCWGCLAYLPNTTPGITDIAPENLYQQCSLKAFPSDSFAVPCIPGNDEAIPCGLYCHMCQLSQSNVEPAGAEYGCDKRFCPDPP